MRKLVQIALAVSLVAIVGVIIWQVLREREPVYHGKRLSVWLVQYGTHHWSEGHWSVGRKGELEAKAENAIRQIGTNAIPTCLRIIATRDSPLLKLVSRFPERWQPFYRLSTPEYQFQGAYGLIALGADAEPAVPALIAMLNDSHAEVKYAAVFALSSLGSLAEDALPSLIECLRPDEFAWQGGGILGLGEVHQEPQRVVRALVQLLDNPRNPQQTQRIHANVIMGLREFGAQAKPAVPSLLRLLNDADEGIRGQVTNALLTIDPEAAARAGVKVTIRHVDLE
jgi:hypothetical protein